MRLELYYALYPYPIFKRLCSVSTPQSKSVLVVDDEWMNRELMEAVLQSAGYRVFLASHAARGFQLAQEHHPDLILLDVRLQHENEGYMLCRQLKADASTQQIIVAMLTSMNSDEDRAAAFAAGADAFLYRLTDTAQLLAQIADLLENPSH